MLENDKEVKRLTAEFKIESGNATVFAEHNWGAVPAHEFYNAYLDSVLIVVLFDDTYQKSEGVYPEWSIIRDMRAQLHGRVLPVKFDKGSDFFIRDAHFNGLIDLTDKNEDEQLNQVRSKIVEVWSKCVSPWKLPPEHVLIHFGKCRPKQLLQNATYIELPKLCGANEDEIINTIASGVLFANPPLRTISVYCPKPRQEEWHLLGKVVARISQEYQTRRRSSAKIPVFIPDEAITQTNEDGVELMLEDLLWHAGNGIVNAQSACERSFRRWGELSSWLTEMSKLPIVNLLTASEISCESGVDLVRQYEPKNTSRRSLTPIRLRQTRPRDESLIVNFWRWYPDSLYRKGHPFALNMHELHHAATNARSNLIHLSEQLATDIREWKSLLNIAPQFADALQKEIIETLCEPPCPGRTIQWQPFLPTNSQITRRADNFVLSQFYCEFPNGGNTLPSDSYQADPL